MAGKEPVANIAIDNKALLAAINAVRDGQVTMSEQFRSEFQKISTTLDQLMGQLNNLKLPKPRAPAASKVNSESIQQAKAIRNPKLYFVDKYMKSEEERQFTSALVKDVRVLNVYTKVDKDPKSKPEDKLRKEAELIYDLLGKRDDMTEYLNKIKTEQKEALAAQKKALGHTTSDAAATSSRTEIPEAGKKVVKRATSKKAVASTSAADAAEPKGKKTATVKKTIKTKKSLMPVNTKSKSTNASPSALIEQAVDNNEDEDEDENEDAFEEDEEKDDETEDIDE